MLSDDTTEMRSWASRLSPPFIHMFAHQQTCFIFPVNRHYSKLLQTLELSPTHQSRPDALGNERKASASWLPCWQTGHMLCTCEPALDTLQHSQRYAQAYWKKACALLAHILGLPAHASLNSAFNLAHRWRVLTALHPALCTHAHTHKHPHSRHQELVLENCNTNWEKKKHRSEAVSGKDDSGENSFSYNWSKRQKKKKKLWSLSVCECTSSVCTCMHACTDTIIPWHFTVFGGHLERGLSPHGWAITETRSQTAEALWQTFWSKAS